MTDTEFQAKLEQLIKQNEILLQQTSLEDKLQQLAEDQAALERAARKLEAIRIR